MGFAIVMGIFGYLVIGIIIGVSLEDDGEEAKDCLAAAILWPLFCLIVAFQWFGPGDDLTRRQKRKLKFEKALLEIEQARNTEQERAMSIIRGT